MSCNYCHYDRRTRRGDQTVRCGHPKGPDRHKETICDVERIVCHRWESKPTPAMERFLDVVEPGRRAAR